MEKNTICLEIFFYNSKYMPYKYEKVSHKTITTVISVHYTVIAIFLYVYDKMYVLSKQTNEL